MRPRARPAGCFTLIELLVVVTIISILASMLMPALTMAREKGRQAKCMNNLRNIGWAFALYYEDNDDWIPPTAFRIVGLGWEEASWREYAIYNYLPDWEYFRCPSNEGNNRPCRDIDSPESYAGNGGRGSGNDANFVALVGSGAAEHRTVMGSDVGPLFKIRRIEEPSQLWLITENGRPIWAEGDPDFRMWARNEVALYGYTAADDVGWCYSKRLYPLHAGVRANFLWCDQRVELIKPLETAGTLNNWATNMQYTNAPTRMKQRLATLDAYWKSMR